MTDSTKWQLLVGGAECPLDAPRPASSDHWDLVGSLSVSSLYTLREPDVPGQYQLIFDPLHVARLDQLSRQEWASFAADLFTAQQAVMRAVTPDHVNVESLGNVVPHLHWHIIPRYVGNPRWGAPIWRVLLDARRAARQKNALPYTTLLGPSSPPAQIHRPEEAEIEPGASERGRQFPLN